VKTWESDLHTKQKAAIFDFLSGDDILYDARLYKWDILGTIAHEIMLERIGVLQEHELKQILKVLLDLLCNPIELDPNLEDVHSNIEAKIIQQLGETGRKVHTLRSRNDQVLLDLKLYMKDQLLLIGCLSFDLAKLFFHKAYEWEDCIFPGYTHHRQAMPYTVSAYFMSFYFSLLQDVEVILNTLDILNKNPLGVGAGFGLPSSLNRELTTELLGFNEVEMNALKTINSRGKNELLCLSALAQVSATLNKFSSDMILFSMTEFAYFEIPEEFCTGSSIMPQKKNPDVFELIKARTSLIASQMQAIYNLMVNLPSGYHRDLQETKKILVNSFESMESILQMLCKILPKLQPNPTAIENHISPEIYATHAALHLLEKGVSYKEAYQEIAKTLKMKEELNPLPVITEMNHSKITHEKVFKGLIIRKKAFQKSIEQIIKLAKSIIGT